MRPDAQTSWPRVTVLVPNRDKRDYLLRCIKCLYASTYRNMDIVVVDDGSADGSVEALRDRFPGVHVVAVEGHPGVPRVRNTGIECALAHYEPEYVLFLDNDAFVEPGAVEELVHAAEANPGAAIVAPKAYRSLATRMLYCAGELRVNLYTGIFRDVGAGELDSGQYDVPRFIDACGGFAMLLRRTAIERAGRFDEAYSPYGWEDVDICLRMAKHGLGIYYTPGARVEHLGGKTVRGPVAAYEAAKTRNLFLLMQKHASAAQWACFLMVLPMRAFLLLAGHLLSGNGRACVAPFRGLWNWLVSRRGQ